MRSLVFLLIIIISISSPAFSNALIKAVQSGKLNAVKRAVAMVDDINAVDELHCTALHYAGIQGDYAIVSYLLANDADPKIYNENTKVAFQVAIEDQAMTAERAKVAALLLHATKGIQGRDQKGWTALYWAILSKDRELIDRFLNEGASLVRHAAPSRLVERQHAIEIATLIKDQSLMQYLLDRFIADEGDDALMVAVKYDLYPIAKILIEQGFLARERYQQHNDSESGDAGMSSVAQYEQYMWDNYHPGYYYEDSSDILSMAVRTRNPKLVTLLLDNSVSPDGQGGGKIPPLKVAARTNEPEIFKILVSYGAKVLLSDPRDLNEVIRWAASNDRESLDLMVGEFLQKNSVDELLAMVRGWHAEKRILSLVNVLRQRGFDVTGSEHLEHILHRAVIANQSDLLEGLLKLGVDVDALNKKGNTPLLEATIRGHTENVRLLLDYGANASATTIEGIDAIAIAKMSEERMQQYQSQMNKDRYANIRKMLADYL